MCVSFIQCVCMCQTESLEFTLLSMCVGVGMGIGWAWECRPSTGQAKRIFFPQPTPHTHHTNTCIPPRTSLKNKWTKSRNTMFFFFQFFFLVVLKCMSEILRFHLVSPSVVASYCHFYLFTWSQSLQYDSFYKCSFLLVCLLLLL